MKTLMQRFITYNQKLKFQEMHIKLHFKILFCHGKNSVNSLCQTSSDQLLTS